MYLVILIAHVVVCISLVTLIMLQHGKGADAGVAFSSSSISGDTKNLGMTKIIACLACIFFITSLALGYFSSHTQVVTIDDKAASHSEG